MKKIIPRIDEKRTKLSLEKALEKYRKYLVTLPVDSMPTITPTYSIIPPSNTYSFKSQTENIAIERVEFETERLHYMNKIFKALETLKTEEKKIIVERFLKEEVSYDIEIWTELNIAKNKYYKLKWEAMLRMAFALKVEVYFNDNESGVAV
ncbi:ArpU family phage transcriptional regulator [Lysinibacillus composti]|uniref:ArpU family transcriptional regulator n=1 Tax=Lysinibacillus composti TaxID=720633 RepID=A0A3N9UVL7_9BACI|nr:ArpU family phage packaging/lysis transcriptional regulator [Lysinibacillus composti]MBM7607559.1 ArpU family phage transcriptional regulator [Lysinibacillus composti]RQW75936.1 ArpU family transcriptional regulator [Lysinibacillus composti]